MYYDNRKAFIEYSNDMKDVNKNIAQYNLGKKSKVLIVYDDMIADMINNKKLNLTVAEAENQTFSLVFITQSYFEVPKGRR